MGAFVWAFFFVVAETELSDGSMRLRQFEWVESIKTFLNLYFRLGGGGAAENGREGPAPES